jgi:hypothetical protein
MIQYVHVPYYFNPEKNTFTLGEENDIDQVRLNVTQELPCLYYDYFIFHANASQEIRAHFDATDAVDFYVTDLKGLDIFNHGLCVYGYIPAFIGTVASAYDLDWKAPATGQYAFLFASNRGNGAYITIHFTANALTTITQSTETTFTSSYPIQTIQTIQTITQNPSGISPAPNLSENSYLPAAVAIFLTAIAFVLLAVIITKRRGLKL